MTTSETLRAEKKKKETEDEKRTRIIGEKYTGKTDRQLLEEQLHLEQIRNKHIKSIKDNVQFFFWLTFIGMLLYAVVFFMAQR